MNTTLLRTITALGMLAIAVPAYLYLPLIGVQILFVLLGYMLFYEGYSITGVPYPSLLPVVSLLLVFLAYQYMAVFATMVYLSWLVRVVWMFQASKLANKFWLLVCQQADIALYIAALLLMYNLDKYVLLYVMTLIVGIDSFGYFGGRAFGKTRICPQISPNKTLEGYCSALLWLCVVTGIIMILRDIPILNLTLSMVVVYILATTGDLLVSYQKRVLNVKDSSSLLPGHGGFLDRFDSWMLVIPFVYLILK